MVYGGQLAGRKLVCGGKLEYIGGEAEIPLQIREEGGSGWQALGKLPFIFCGGKTLPSAVSRWQM